MSDGAGQDGKESEVEVGMAERTPLAGDQMPLSILGAGSIPKTKKASCCHPVGGNGRSMYMIDSTLIRWRRVLHCHCDAKKFLSMKDKIDSPSRCDRLDRET
jgi:hypothetical protein